MSGEAARQGASADRRGLARFLPVSEVSAWAYGCWTRHGCHESDAGMGMIRQEGERVIHKGLKTAFMGVATLTRFACEMDPGSTLRPGTSPGWFFTSPSHHHVHDLAQPADARLSRVLRAPAWLLCPVPDLLRSPAPGRDVRQLHARPRSPRSPSCRFH